MPDPIMSLAGRLLEQPLDVVLTARILRDLYHLPADDPRRLAVDRAVLSSPQVITLLTSQRSDGSWNRLPGVRQTGYPGPVGLAEMGLRRSRSLGLEPDHPALSRTADWLADRLSVDQSRSEDLAERLRLAALLRLARPDHPLAIQEAQRWREVLSLACQGAGFDRVAYANAIETVFGLSADKLAGLAPLHQSGYLLELVRGLLPPELEQTWLTHLFEQERGIWPICNRSLRHLPLVFPSCEVVRYIAALERLTGYSTAVPFLNDAFDWLWQQRNAAGFWDLSSPARDGIHLPLSVSWRSHANRTLDSTVRVLILLQHIQGQCLLVERNCHVR